LTVEVEMRLRDAQALARRIALKRRDDPSLASPRSGMLPDPG
jgi:hypothetical protein